jgi:hypothetical protein
MLCTTNSILRMLYVYTLLGSYVYNVYTHIWGQVCIYSYLYIWISMNLYINIFIYIL